MRTRTIIISAPSGTGKTSLVEKLLGQNGNLKRAVTHTTRALRTAAGELEGVDYHFVTKAEFSRLKEDNQFFETAEIYGNFYGTSKKAVAKIIDAGQQPILVVDVQGAANIKKLALPDLVLLFIKPPSINELRKRLTKRGTESDAMIELRMARYDFEISQMKEFDVVLINNQIDKTVSNLLKIIRGYNQ